MAAKLFNTNNGNSNESSGFYQIIPIATITVPIDQTKKQTNSSFIFLKSEVNQLPSPKSEEQLRNYVLNFGTPGITYKLEYQVNRLTQEKFIAIMSGSSKKVDIKDNQLNQTTSKEKIENFGEESKQSGMKVEKIVEKAESQKIRLAEKILFVFAVFFFFAALGLIVLANKPAEVKYMEQIFNFIKDFSISIVTLVLGYYFGTKNNKNV